MKFEREFFAVNNIPKSQKYKKLPTPLKMKFFSFYFKTKIQMNTIIFKELNV